MTAVTVTDLNNAKLDTDTIGAVATSTAPTVTDRLGNTKNTLSGMNAVVLASAAAVQGSIGYLPPVTYAAGISLTLAAQTVGYSGQTYAPLLSALPFTTSGTFETANFRLIQGVAGADLAAPTGATLVNFLQDGFGAVSRWVKSKLAERVSPQDFGATGLGTVDDSDAFQKALNTGKNVVGVSGSTYLIAGGCVSNTVGQVVDMTGCTIKLINAAANKISLKATADYVKIFGGMWDGNKANNSGGDEYASANILFANCKGGRVVGITSKNSYGMSIKGVEVDNFRAIDNDISGTTLYGIYLEALIANRYRNRAIDNQIDMTGAGLDGQGVLFTSANGFRQLDWQLKDNDVIGVDDPALVDQAICLAVRGDRGRVQGNHTRFGSMGFSEGGSDTLISDNKFMDLRGSIRMGIEPSGPNVSIIGNQVTNALQSVSCSGNQDFDNLTVVGNNFRGSFAGVKLQIAPGHTGRDIEISGNNIGLTSGVHVATSGDISGLFISGNRLKGGGSGVSGSCAVFLDSPLSFANVTVSGNKISDVERAYAVYSASATTFTDLRAVGNDTYNVPASDTWSAQGSATIGPRVFAAFGVNNQYGGSIRKQVIDQQSNVFLFWDISNNSPEGAITAGVGSLVIELDGSVWSKRTGTGNTGWVAL